MFVHTPESECTTRLLLKAAGGGHEPGIGGVIDTPNIVQTFKLRPSQLPPHAACHPMLLTIVISRVCIFLLYSRRSPSVALRLGN